MWHFIFNIFIKDLYFSIHKTTLCNCGDDNILYTLRNEKILLKKRLWYRCFLVNFAKFLRKPFLTEHLPWLLLDCLWKLYRTYSRLMELRNLNICIICVLSLFCSNNLHFISILLENYCFLFLCFSALCFEFNVIFIDLITIL